MGISYHQLQKGPPPVTRVYKCYNRSDSKAMVHPRDHSEQHIVAFKLQAACFLGLFGFSPRPGA